MLNLSEILGTEGSWSVRSGCCSGFGKGAGDVQLEMLRAQLWLLLLECYCSVTNKQNSFFWHFCCNTKRSLAVYKLTLEKEPCVLFFL